MLLLNFEDVRNGLLDLEHVSALLDDWMHIHSKLSVNSKNEPRFLMSGSQHPGGIRLTSTNIGAANVSFRDPCSALAFKTILQSRKQMTNTEIKCISLKLNPYDNLKPTPIEQALHQ
jgi:hypothetical protein